MSHNVNDQNNVKNETRKNLTTCLASRQHAIRQHAICQHAIRQHAIRQHASLLSTCKPSTRKPSFNVQSVNTQSVKMQSVNMHAVNTQVYFTFNVHAVNKLCSHSGSHCLSEVVNKFVIDGNIRHVTRLSSQVCYRPIIT